MKKQYDLDCNIAKSLNVIGDRWTLLILHGVKEGHTTYKQLQQHLLTIPSNLLSNRLKSLCEDGLLTTSLYSSHPPRYEYHLTKMSEDLQDVFYALILWGEKHVDSACKHLAHEDCDGKVEIAYVCRKCGKIVDSEQLYVHK